MSKFISTTALLAALTSAALSCSSEAPTVIEAAGVVVETGAASLGLTVGDRTITTVTAVLSRPQGGFQTQTHAIDVTGDNGVVSVTFGNLPVGRGYEITLTAADCTGTSRFDVVAGVTTQVPVAITCPGGGSAQPEAGSARITGTIVPGAPPLCDHVSKITAGPSIQNGDGPAIAVHLLLDPGVTATNIVWTTSSTNGGSGTIGELIGSTDPEVTFDCTTTGLVQLVAAVTAPQATGSACTEQVRVSIECVNQAVAGPECGDGIINLPTEQCDGTILPPGTPAGSTCSASCTLVAPPPRCGDGIINGTDQCDGAALPPSAPPGSSCSATCTLVTDPGFVCGDGIINGTEQCDGAVLPPNAPAGSTCSSACTLLAIILCGDTIISGTEECDGPTLPPSAPAGSTCSATCTLVTPSTSGTCHNTCVENEETASCSLEFAAVAADSDPLMDCLLGASWPAPDKFPAGSCVNGALLSCYCGSLASGACISAPPSTLTGQCKDQILEGTGCNARPAAEQGACVAQRFTLDNTAGRALNYAACLQNNCPETCTSAP